MWAVWERPNKSHQQSFHFCQICATNSEAEAKVILVAPEVRLDFTEEERQQKACRNPTEVYQNHDMVNDDPTQSSNTPPINPQSDE